MANVGGQAVNTTKHTEVNRRRMLVATAVAFILMVSSLAVPVRPGGAAAARPEADKELASHRVYLAAEQKVVVDQARNEAGAAHVAAASSNQQAAELQRQLDLLQTKPADYGLAGLVLTLGDVLFTSGRADLKPGAMFNLNKLVNFLARYPDHSVTIHGYTDSVGSEEYNHGLSERRANSVKAYLAGQGIDSRRLSASGMGQSHPVAGNGSGAGRQQNRRVEVIISNPPAAPAALTQRARTARMIVLLTLLGSISGSVGRPIL
jgi:outer membrane protein OmpA-like peptidoglycan-associated protein